MTIVETIHSPRRTTVLDPGVLEVGMHLVRPWNQIKTGDSVVRNMSKIPGKIRLFSSKIRAYRRLHDQVKSVMIYENGNQVRLERKDVLYCIKRTF